MANEFLKNTFGTNIKLPQYTIKRSKQTLDNAVKSLWEPVYDFVDKTNTFINGDIQKEINFLEYTGQQFKSLNPPTTGTKFNKMC